jgi:hypothetical protein
VHGRFQNGERDYHKQQAKIKFSFVTCKKLVTETFQMIQMFSELEGSSQSLPPDFAVRNL